MVEVVRKYSDDQVSIIEAEVNQAWARNKRTDRG